MRRKTRPDANQAEIVQALRRVGCRVKDMTRFGEGMPDLLVRLPGQGDLMLIEVKTARGTLNKTQRAWEAEGWPVFVVRSVSEALKLVLG